MFRAVPVDHPHRQQHSDRRPDDVFLQNGNVEITQTRPAAERSSYGEVGDQEQRADYREQSPLRTRCGINTAAIGKITADDSVINSNQAGENAYRKNDRQ